METCICGRCREERPVEETRKLTPDQMLSIGAVLNMGPHKHLCRDCVVEMWDVIREAFQPVAVAIQEMGNRLAEWAQTPEVQSLVSELEQHKMR